MVIVFRPPRGRSDRSWARMLPLGARRPGGEEVRRGPPKILPRCRRPPLIAPPLRSGTGKLGASEDLLVSSFAPRAPGLQNLSAHPKDLSAHRRGPRKSCLSRARVLAPQPRPEPEIFGERNFVVSSFASHASGLVGRFWIIYRRASRKPEAENAPLVDQLTISSLTAALNVKWQ